MIELIYKYEPTIRLTVFLGGFSLLALWEWLRPRRKLTTNKFNRWVTNFALILTSTFLVRFLIPTAAIGVAYFAEKNHLGIANHLEEVDFWIKCVVTFVLLDLIIYFQHLFFHVLPILWRIHRVHHSDLDCDVTTGLRFHPVEILLSIVIKFGAILILGVPVLTVILFEVILNFMSMFDHSNIFINKKFERVLRWFITTPDMHRVHHSMIENETNSNFTFFISLWDRLFGTYLEAPTKGHLEMSLGLGIFKDSKCLTYQGLIKMPLIGKIHGYAINYRDTRNADELERINTQLNVEIEEKNKQAQELILARDEAEKANAAKTQFISNMSHELRTPMHGILSFSKFGIKKIDKVPHEKLLSYFTSIQSSGERLLYLINNLLDLAKLESGTLELHKSKSNLSEILDACVNEQRARLEELDITINVTIIPDSTKAFFDTDLISQVITNLLSNSIKFTPTNSTICIAISNIPFDYLNISNKKNQLYFSIKDQGVGIPKNELNDIFVSFKQSSRTETGAGGTGLGLAISKDIIDAHGGEIWAMNNPDSNGAIFIFSIPVV